MSNPSEEAVVGSEVSCLAAASERRGRRRTGSNIINTMDAVYI
jgi:hypothetical protein